MLLLKKSKPCTVVVPRLSPTSQTVCTFKYDNHKRTKFQDGFYDIWKIKPGRFCHVLCAFALEANWLLLTSVSKWWWSQWQTLVCDQNQKRVLESWRCQKITNRTPNFLKALIFTCIIPMCGILVTMIRISGFLAEFHVRKYIKYSRVELSKWTRIILNMIDGQSNI